MCPIHLQTLDVGQIGEGVSADGADWVGRQDEQGQVLIVDETMVRHKLNLVGGDRPGNGTQYTFIVTMIMKFSLR